ncbi:hypothetical protein PPL_02304 [Heterostelium album PN500]|uniref:Ankyrin repeat protein n=1 Tax=Heterostelium pallidum (strain ATCC 26659 / Pp 5 / PN500) TaxID=670386 RepID=D3B1X9_HETP5|nr:hypothetical protein PPL_02304 [Heterostelium album PN500]EFA85303.1 hypothetical protein PPL_02304 [Heterostelium album PN500]|eukprot:XP_020437412.1 hypothetical protein PPL_02304 [Heterostelium album PN500]
MTFSRILNNKYIFERVVHFLHEGHHLYACKYRNREIDDALWLAKTGSFDIIRNKIKSYSSITNDSDYPLLYWPAKSLSILFEKQHYDIIESLFNHRSVSSRKYLFLTTDVVDTAIRSQVSIDMLSTIEKLFPESITWRIFTTAAEVGSLLVIEWLRKIRPLITPAGSATNNAALNGHMHVIKYLHDSGRWAIFSSRTLDCAIKGGKLEIVEYILANRTEGLTHETIDLLTTNKEMHDIIERIILAKKNPLYESIQCSAKSLVEASRHGNLKLLRLLIENEKRLSAMRGISIVQQDVDNAIYKSYSSVTMSLMNGNISCFDYLSKTPIYSNSIKYILYMGWGHIFRSSSSYENEIAFIDYLKDKKYPLNKDVLFRLVSNGDAITQGLISEHSATQKQEVLIEILDRLHKFTGCPLVLNTSQVELISNSSVEMLRYLFGIYQQDKNNYILAAAKFGCLDIVQKSYRNEQLIKEAYKIALRAGHIEIIVYLTETFHIRADLTSAYEAFNSGRVALSSYLLENRDMFFLDDLAVCYSTMQNNHYLFERLKEKVKKTGRPIKGVGDIIISKIKSLVELKMVTSDLCSTESLGLNYKVDENVFCEMAHKNKIDQIVYLEESGKLSYFERFVGANALYQNSILIALHNGKDETVSYLVDRLKVHYPKNFPKKLYNILLDGVDDDSKETNENYRLFINFKKRLIEEILPLVE